MDKFIDLGVDDNHSAFGDGMAGRQQKFKDHLQKMDFQFQTTCLDMPTGNEQNEELLHPDREMLEEVTTADSTMGADLDQIFQYLTVQANEDLGKCEVIVDHKWNSKKGSFE